jgi:hypothetical protein
MSTHFETKLTRCEILLRNERILARGVKRERDLARRALERIGVEAGM